MSRGHRNALWIIGTALALVVALLGVMAALRYEPDFYGHAMAADAQSLEKDSDEMLKRAAALVGDVQRSGKWQIRVTAEQINGWLAVDFVKNHSGSLPPQFHDPRVSIEADGIVLACRYKHGVISTILTITILPYVPEENMLALRVARVRAGLVPMSLEKVLDGISDAARKHLWRIEWRQTAGDPVALLSAPPPDEDDDLAVKITSVQLGNGEITISGSNERKK